MARKKKMDKLSQEVAMAHAAGMSYGRWKAMQEPVKIVKPDTLPEGWKKCEECGKPFKSGKGKKFCDEVCRRTAYDKSGKAMEYVRRYRAKRRAEMAKGELG